MKLKLKMIAIAAAMVSLAGAAQAAPVTESTNNGSLVLTAFNQVTKAWYIRDLGFTINSFLPTGILASVGDPLSSAVGDKTPNTPLLLDKNNTATFSDASSWTTWIAGQNVADIRWNVNAVDTFAGSGQLKSRLITSSANGSETASNGNINNFVAVNNAGSAQSYFTNFGSGGTAGLSSFSNNPLAPYQTSLDSNFLLGADGLASLDQGVSLFYFARTTESGSTGTFATPVKYGNTTGFAVVKLEADGDFSYNLAGDQVGAVPIPAAAWLMGSGLMALGGVVRRRKGAAQA